MTLTDDSVMAMAALMLLPVSLVMRMTARLDRRGRRHIDPITDGERLALFRRSL